MAANIQMIFLRNSNNEVIVKLLHNENPVGVNLKSDIFPYYRWNELKAYFEERLRKPYSQFMQK
ncbi:MAG: hypothetical protein K2F70_05400, partial [Muribaculaceae bacterium]|nr:hypothetical protein [Muribaculaceae bacterium]